MCKGKIFTLSGIALAFGMVGTVEAASQLASGPVFGGNSEGQVACLVVNTGSVPVHFNSTQLVGQFKGSLDQNFNDCTSRQSLVPGAMCSFQADVNAQGTGPHQAVSCKVVITEAKTNVRGTMVALDPLLGRPLSQTDLR